MYVSAGLVAEGEMMNAGPASAEERAFQSASVSLDV
jgi:hypothetical protein